MHAVRESIPSKSDIVVEIIEYIPNSIVCKTIIRKATGNITVTSFSRGEELQARYFQHDIFIQIIDGSAQLEIKDKVYKLRLGEGIVIPAKSIHSFKAHTQFKMISTVIATQGSAW